MKWCLLEVADCAVVHYFYRLENRVIHSDGVSVGMRAFNVPGQVMLADHIISRYSTPAHWGKGRMDSSTKIMPLFNSAPTTIRVK